MITKSDLKDILKKNNIRAFSWMDKKTLVRSAKEHGLWPEKPRATEKPRDPKFDILKDIKNNPREVLVKDIKTGEIRDFPSIYKASKFIQCCPQTVTNWNGRVWEGKYKVVLP